MTTNILNQEERNQLRILSQKERNRRYFILESRYTISVRFFGDARKWQYMLEDFF